MTAVFDAELNAPTGVIEGRDGVYRIGRVTEQADPVVDGAFNDTIVGAGINPVDYREAARADVLRQKLSDKIVAGMKQPGTQRQVLEIYLPEPNASTLGAEPGVKVRHILFAPNDNADNADDLDENDPAWAKAKAEADAAYARLKADPEDFDEMARGVSDEPSAKDTGGKQPWYYPTSSVDSAFKNAIFAEGLEPGELLAPVKSAFGWHVIQFMRPAGDGDTAWLEEVKAEIKDDAGFKQAARDNSEGDEAGDGGDIGWIAMGQLTDALDGPIFSTAIGQMTDVITVSGDGNYLLKVVGEETRTPTEEQIQIFEDTGFQYWYAGQKAAADIEYKLASTPATG